MRERNRIDLSREEALQVAQGMKKRADFISRDGLSLVDMPFPKEEVQTLASLGLQPSITAKDLYRISKQMVANEVEFKPKMTELRAGLLRRETIRFLESCKGPQVQ